MLVDIYFYPTLMHGSVWRINRFQALYNWILFLDIWILLNHWWCLWQYCYLWCCQFWMQVTVSIYIDPKPWKKCGNFWILELIVSNHSGNNTCYLIHFMYFVIQYFNIIVPVHDDYPCFSLIQSPFSYYDVCTTWSILMV